jgi:hypothetical protein
MSRPHHDVLIPAIALRRTEAAAAIGVSQETFDEHIRAHLPTMQLGSVVVYPVAGIQRYLEANQSITANDLLPQRHRRTA